MPPFIRPDQPIAGLGATTFGDFWSWAYSDILSNANRSVFAEYLVGSALDVVKHPRVEWDACDFRYRGRKIEVKASAYLQSWQQKKLSTIAFDIAPHIAWDAETNTFAPQAARSADCYVFCLFTDRDRSDCEVSKPSRWVFYVAPTVALAERFGGQKRARLSSIERIARPVPFDRLRAEIDSVLALAADALP